MVLQYRGHCRIPFCRDLFPLVVGDLNSAADSSCVVLSCRMHKDDWENVKMYTNYRNEFNTQEALVIEKYEENICNNEQPVCIPAAWRLLITNRNKRIGQQRCRIRHWSSNHRKIRNFAENVCGYSENATNINKWQQRHNKLNQLKFNMICVILQYGSSSN